MKAKRFGRLVAVCVALGASTAWSQDVALKPGESVDLFPVYWIADCKSTLKQFLGAEVLVGPPQLSVSLREEPVAARRQGCAQKVPGAILVLAAGGDAAAFEGTVRVRVRYSTEDGEKQSVHPVKVLVVAPAK
jgi:hypothetical protein